MGNKAAFERLSSRAIIRVLLHSYQSITLGLTLKLKIQTEASQQKYNPHPRNGGTKNEWRLDFQRQHYSLVSWIKT